jgi:hypothetical protein
VVRPQAALNQRAGAEPPFAASTHTSATLPSPPDRSSGRAPTIVTGSAEVGGELRFGLAGLDEQIVMRVDDLRPPTAVGWSCVAHTRDGEWTGTRVRFELSGHLPDGCELDFRHTGIAPELVAEGWDHFLASLAGYAERGEGSPFG